MDRCYVRMLRGYPPAFQAEFGPEMQQTFRRGLAQAAAAGWLVILGFWLRELVDWPICLVREHAAAWKERGEESRMSNTIETHPRQPGTWHAALWAGLPHLLFAHSLALVSGLFPFFLPSTFWQSNKALFALLLIAGVVIGWRKGWPEWSASWLGYAFLVAFGIAVQLPHEVNVPRRWAEWWETILTLVWFALFLTGLILALRRSLVRGLLLMFPVVPMGFWLIVLDEMTSIFPKYALYLLAGVLVALLAAVIVRSTNPILPAGLTLLVMLAVNLFMTWGSYAYPAYLGPNYQAPEPTLPNILEGGVRSLLFPLIFMSPIWIEVVWLWVKRLRNGHPPTV